MEPFWQSQTVHDETVLLVASGRKPAIGTLMFMPTQILSVKDYGLSISFLPNRDFIVQGRTIVRQPDSKMPFMRRAALPRAPYKWYEIDGRHIVVSYTHRGCWKGPVPQYHGAALPQTMHRLRHRLPLSVVAYGDSITRGDNVSGYIRIAPFMPTWAELFVERLSQLYQHGAIRLHNASRSGETSSWGLAQADHRLAALDPDLVVLAFGMNDFWSLSSRAFQANIQAIIERVRRRRPTVEFLLISPMCCDPAYAPEPAYAKRLAAYARALQALTGRGVQLLDMQALSRALFKSKAPWDLLANPLHPNDFLARWYAQGLVAQLHPPSAGNRRQLRK